MRAVRMAGSLAPANNVLSNLGSCSPGHALDLGKDDLADVVVHSGVCSAEVTEIVNADEMRCGLLHAFQVQSRPL